MYLTIRGLVLRVTDYNDRDSLITLLTADRGRITVKARGLRRKNSPLIAPCQLLAYGEYTLFEYRGMFTINEAVSLELFQNLHRDLQKLSLGTYLAQVCEVISQEDISNPELLSLLLNSLYALSKLGISEQKVKAVFEFRTACLAGYQPDLKGCICCGSILPDRLDLSAGYLECARCRNFESDGIRMPLSRSLLLAMRYIAFCDPKKIFLFEMSADDIQSLSHVTEAYLTTQLERSFSALEFYKSLLI